MRGFWIEDWAQSKSPNDKQIINSQKNILKKCLKCGKKWY